MSNWLKLVEAELRAAKAARKLAKHYRDYGDEAEAERHEKRAASYEQFAAAGMERARRETK